MTLSLLPIRCGRFIQDGSIELQSSITSTRPSLTLPRLGYVMKVPQEYANFTYYGRGPIDNYADRKSGQFIEQHTNTVAGEFLNFRSRRIWVIMKMYVGVH